MKTTWKFPFEIHHRVFKSTLGLAKKHGSLDGAINLQVEVEEEEVDDLLNAATLALCRFQQDVE